MSKAQPSTVTHVAITWGDDYPLLATQVAPGESLRLGGSQGPPAFSAQPVATLIDEKGRLCVPAGGRLHWLQRSHARSTEPVGEAEPGAGGRWWWLQRGDRVRVEHAGLCYFVESAEPERAAADRPWLAWRWDAVTSFAFAGSLALHGLFLVMGMLLPPTASALSLDLAGEDISRARYLLTAAATPPPPPLDWIESADPGGDSGEPAEGSEGSAGEPDAPSETRQRRVPRGPVTKPVDLDHAQVANAGMLQQLIGYAPLAAGSSYTDPSALDPDARLAMGAIFGAKVGESLGIGGRGMRGTGRGGGGDATGTYGVGSLKTRGGAGVGPGHGGSLGGMRRQGGGPPRVRPGPVELAGSLSKEVIRRSIRRHINEVRFCYEQGLTRRPDLAGRVSVFFLIRPDGSVGRSAVQSSTLADGAVGDCIAKAVRRWPFPQPIGGGIVSVTYPFVLQSAP